MNEPSRPIPRMSGLRACSLPPPRSLAIMASESAAFEPRRVQNAIRAKRFRRDELVLRLLTSRPAPPK